MLKIGDIFRNINNSTIIVVTKISADYDQVIVYAAYITHETVSRTRIDEVDFDTSILGMYWTPVEI